MLFVTSPSEQINPSSTYPDIKITPGCCDDGNVTNTPESICKLFKLNTITIDSFDVCADEAAHGWIIIAYIANDGSAEIDTIRLAHAVNLIARLIKEQRITSRPVMIMRHIAA